MPARPLLWTTQLVNGPPVAYQARAALVGLVAQRKATPLGLYHKGELSLNRSVHQCRYTEHTAVGTAAQGPGEQDQPDRKLPIV